MQPHLSLGTAQFGMDYGVTNKSGKIKSIDINEILKYANKIGINFIDTAQAYGQAEKLIGKSLPKLHNFKFISKLPPIGNKYVDENYLSTLESNFQKSLNSLKQDSIDIFLIHSCLDLKGNNGTKIIKWLFNLKDKGLVKRLGISIYEKEDLKKISLNDFDIIQLPISLYDQRMLKNGTIELLSSNNIAIHCRSIFLQGLILEQKYNWPNFLSNSFKEWHSENLLKFKSQNLKPLEVALAFIKRQKNIESAIVGITSLAELKEINSCWESLNSKNTNLNFCDLGWDNNLDIDPRNWS